MGSQGFHLTGLTIFSFPKNEGFIQQVIIKRLTKIIPKQQKQYFILINIKIYVIDTFKILFHSNKT